jgi:hypothetical protein
VCVCVVIPPTSSSAISSLYVFSREEYAWKVCMVTQMVSSPNKVLHATVIRLGLRPSLTREQNHIVGAMEASTRRWRLKRARYPSLADQHRPPC